MRTTNRWLTAATLAVVMVAGCRSSSEEVREEGRDAAAETARRAEPVREPEPGEAAVPAVGGSATLEGTSWRLVSYGPDEPVAEGIEFTAEIAEGRIAGRSACNRYTGPVEIDAAAGTLKPGALVSTKMACLEPEMAENESRYLGALQGVTRFDVVDDRLTLQGAEGATLVFERAESAP